MGDGIQAAKAGILEIGDVFVVNKADRDGAATTARELRHMIALAERGPGAWRPPVVTATATIAAGIDDVVAALDAHRDRLGADGGQGLAERRRRRAAGEIEAIALAGLRRRIDALPAATGLAHLAGRVAAVAGANLDPYTAADQLLAALLRQPQERGDSGGREQP
jgi:LAO/AO transport system kinase